MTRSCALVAAALLVRAHTSAGQAITSGRRSTGKSYTLRDVLLDIRDAMSNVTTGSEPPCPDGVLHLLSGKSIYLVSQNHQGISNQLAGISGGYAASCDKGAAAVVISWMFGTFGPSRTPFDSASFLDLERTNTQLSSWFRCRGGPPPVLLPRSCAVVAAQTPLNVTMLHNAKEYSYSLRTRIGRRGYGRHRAATTVLTTFVPKALPAIKYRACLVETPGLQVNPSVQLALQSDTFDALQVNLGVDWLLYRMNDGGQLHKRFYFGDHNDRLKITAECCTRGLSLESNGIKARVQQMVKEAHRHIVKAVTEFLTNKSRPILLLTSIGKSGFKTGAEWIIEDLLALLPGYSFYLGQSESTGVGFNAAAELAAASKASKFIPFPGSQFGWMVQVRVQRAGGEVHFMSDALYPSSQHPKEFRAKEFPDLSQLHRAFVELSNG